jgi:hypothetical protein
MTKLQTIIAAIALAIVAGALYKWVPSAEVLAGGLASFALIMLGWAKQHPEDAAKLKAAKDEEK